MVVDRNERGKGIEASGENVLSHTNQTKAKSPHDPNKKGRSYEKDRKQ